MTGMQAFLVLNNAGGLMEGVTGNVQPSPCINVSSVRNILPQAAMHNFYHANPMSCPFVIVTHGEKVRRRFVQNTLIVGLHPHRPCAPRHSPITTLATADTPVIFPRLHTVPATLPELLHRSEYVNSRYGPGASQRGSRGEGGQMRGQRLRE